MNELLVDLLFIMLGYLSGSVLYAKVFARIFGCSKGIEDSKDHNPGTANAFAAGGFWCGILTLACDLAKGAVPVMLYRHFQDDPNELALAMVVASPVIGHAFPWWCKLRGGKAIAVSFGCLLGLLPEVAPVLSLCLFFVLFSVLLIIESHFHRTAISFICALLLMFFVADNPAYYIGFFIITVVVCLRLHLSEEEREKFRVRMIWMH